MDRMILILGSFLLTCLTPFLLGGKTTQSYIGIEKCTFGWLFGGLVYIAVTGFLWYKGAEFVLQLEEDKKQLGSGWAHPEAVKWDYNN